MGSRYGNIKHKQRLKEKGLPSSQIVFIIGFYQVINVRLNATHFNDSPEFISSILLYCCKTFLDFGKLRTSQIHYLVGKICQKNQG